MIERPIASASQDEIDLVSLAKRAWRFRWVVAFITCVAPIAVFLFIWMQPESYESTATIVIAPHTFVRPVNPASPLDLGPLSKEGYQQEAVSDAVLDLLRQKLQNAGIPPAVIDGRRALVTNAHASVPWVDLTALAPDPSHARTIANAWAAALLEVDHVSGEGRKHKEIDDIIKSHAKAASTVTRIDGELRAARARHLRATINADLDLDEGQKTAELVAMQQRAFAIEDEIGRTKATLEETKERISEYERQLRDATIDLPREPSSAKAVAQENAHQLNPVFHSLSEQLSRERGVLRGLQARDAVLQTQLREARAEVDRLRREVSNVKLALAKRSAQQDEEVDSLNLSRADAREELQKLGEVYREAIAARDSPTSYLRIGTPAALPSTPQRKSFNGALFAIPFALLGSLACAAVAGIMAESRKQQVAATVESDRR